MRERLLTIGYICVVLILGALEICAYILHSNFSLIASRVWVGLGIVFFAILIRYIIKSFFSAIKYRDFAFFLSLLIIIGVLGFDFNSHHGITHENTQQIAETIQNIKAMPDWNYTGIAFLGYPQRQLYIAAVPTIIFGRSIYAVKLGYITPLILGAILFYFALTKVLPIKSKFSSVPALAMLSVFTFPYIVEFGRFYEQAIFPVSFTLIACSFCILTVKKPSLLNFFGLLWIGSLLGTSYTPALAPWALLLLFPFFFTFTKNIPKNSLQQGVIFVTDIFIVLIGVLSFFTRTDIAFSIDANNLSMHTVVTDVLSSFSLFFLPTEHFFLSPILLVPILLYFLLTISGKNGYRHIMVIVWILGVVASTSYFKGYADPDVSLALHRAMVIIPVLIIGMILAWQRTSLFQNLQKAVFYQYLILVLFCLFIVTNLIKTFIPFDNINMMVKDDFQMIIAKQKTVNNIVIIASMPDILSFEAYANYFFPDVTVTIKSECPFDDVIDKNSVLYIEKDFCEAQQQKLYATEITGQIIRQTTDNRL